MRVNIPYFTIEPKVLVYRYAQEVVDAFYKACGPLDAPPFIWPTVPATEGKVESDFILPMLMEVDLSGKTYPASERRWQQYIVSLLTSDNLIWLGSKQISAPSQAYNQAFFSFHLSRMRTERSQREFIGYLRDFLLTLQNEANLDEQEELARLWLDTLNWLEPYSKQLKGQLLANPKVTIKQQVLAYKLLFEYGCIPLQNSQDTAQQVAYIDKQIKGDKRTIERYLTSNLTAKRPASQRYFIYGEDNFDGALRYIKKIMPTVDTSGFRLDKVYKPRR